MASRLDLQQELIAFLGSDKVYFEPTEDILLSYPCIVYSHSDVFVGRADNSIYMYRHKYEVTYISEDPNGDEVGFDEGEPVEDSSVIQQFLLTFPKSRFVRNFTADGLYHSVFELFY